MVLSSLKRGAEEKYAFLSESQICRAGNAVMTRLREEASDPILTDDFNTWRIYEECITEELHILLFWQTTRVSVDI